MRIVCFHNPDEENGYLSNWFPSPFVLAGIRYSSMEQYMMHRKALCFGDMATADEIMSVDDAARIKELGRRVSGYDDRVWSGVRQSVVYEGLLAKFGQNAELREKLIGTADAVLAECAVRDRVWGIGLSMKDPDRLDRGAWKGMNLLGNALMAVREALGRESSN